MNSKIVQLLLVLSALFLAVLLLEWVLIGISDRKLKQSVNEVYESTDSVIELPELKLSKKPIEAYTDLVERPLFIKGRRPIIEEAPEEGPDEVANIDNIELFGIYLTQEEKKALFSEKGAGSRAYLKKSEGEEISGWYIKTIYPDSVLLEQSGNNQTLLLRKPKPKHIKPPASTGRREINRPHAEDDLPEQQQDINTEAGLPDEL